MSESISSISPEPEITRRDFLHAAGVGAATLAVASIAPHILNPNEVRYETSDIGEIQRIIDESNGKYTTIVIDGELTMPEDYEGVGVVPFTTVQEDQLSDENTIRSAMLYIPPGSNITIQGGDWTPVQEEKVFDHAIYADKANLTIRDATFKNGKGPAEQLEGEETAFVFGDKSRLTIKECTFEGKDDIVGNAPIIVDDKQTGSRPKGLNGVYGYKSEVNIRGSSFLNNSWDSITVNGGSLDVSNCFILGARDGINAGVGVGVTHGARAKIKNTLVMERAKSILTTDGSNSYIEHCAIAAGARSISNNGKCIFGGGVVQVSNSLLYSYSSCLELRNPKSTASGCLMLVEFLGGFASLVKEGKMTFEEAYLKTSWMSDTKEARVVAQSPEQMYKNRIIASPLYVNHGDLVCSVANMTVFTERRNSIAIDNDDLYAEFQTIAQDSFFPFIKS